MKKRDVQDVLIAKPAPFDRSRKQISQEAKGLNTLEHLNQSNQQNYCGNGINTPRIFSAWEKVKEINCQKDLKELENTTLTPVEALIHYVIDGIYPPPEVLISLAECFEFYLNANGEVGLEEVFFGKPKRGVGVYAKQLARDGLCYIFDANWQHHHREGTGVPQTLIAEEILDSLPADHPDRDMDIEAFLLRWRRWKKKEKE